MATPSNTGGGRRGKGKGTATDRDGGGDGDGLTPREKRNVEREEATPNSKHAQNFSSQILLNQLSGVRTADLPVSDFDELEAQIRAQRQIARENDDAGVWTRFKQSIEPAHRHMLENDGLTERFERLGFVFSRYSEDLMRNNRALREEVGQLRGALQAAEEFAEHANTRIHSDDFMDQLATKDHEHEDALQQERTRYQGMIDDLTARHSEAEARLREQLNECQRQLEEARKKAMTNESRPPSDFQEGVWTGRFSEQTQRYDAAMAQVNALTTERTEVQRTLDFALGIDHGPTRPTFAMQVREIGSELKVLRDQRKVWSETATDLKIARREADKLKADLAKERADRAADEEKWKGEIQRNRKRSFELLKETRDYLEPEA